MEFREGAGVFTPDGRHLGIVDFVLVNPRTRRVTHVVIRRGHLLPEDKVISVERLSTATKDRIVLNAEPEQLPTFEETHYFPSTGNRGRSWDSPTESLSCGAAGWVGAFSCPRN
jgi:uncharacterized protein YrrD